MSIFYEKMHPEEFGSVEERDVIINDKPKFKIEDPLLKTLISVCNSKKQVTKCLIIDTETCALGVTNNDFCQIAVVEYDFVTDKSKIILNEICRPNRPMTPEAFEVHHISPKPSDRTSKEVIDDLKIILSAYSSNTCIVTYNGEKFDLPLLQNLGVNFDRFEKLDLFVVAQREFAVLPSLNLVDLHSHFCPDIKFNDAHDALNDVNATLNIMKEICDIEGFGQLIVETKNPVVYTIMPFGKYRGKQCDQVPFFVWSKYNFFENLSRDMRKTVDYYLNKPDVSKNKRKN